MNQILDYNPNKNTKTSSGSDKIVKVFAIILIVFALCLVIIGIYKMMSSKSTGDLPTEETPKANIETEQLENSLMVSVSHTQAIEKVIYSWNNGTETTRKGTGANFLEIDVPLPVGTNTIHIKVIDVSGGETDYEKEIVSENGIDIINPVIEIDITTEKKIKITATDETKLDFITYQWNDEEEKQLKPENDEKKIETEIEILKGKDNLLTVNAVDSSKNTTTRSKKITGVTKPEVKLTLTADKKYVSVSIQHENGINEVTGILNGTDFKVDGVKDAKEATFNVQLVDGKNNLTVLATSVDGTETKVEQEFVNDSNVQNQNTNTDLEKPKISIDQDSTNAKKVKVTILYEKGLKSAMLQLNGQSFDVNNIENQKDVNFEFEIQSGENKVIVTAVGIDGTTGILEKTFNVE